MALELERRALSAKKKPYYVWTIFLIKAEFQDDKSILNAKYVTQLDSHVVGLADGTSADLYVKRAYPVQPKWARVLGGAVSPPITEKSQSPSAILLVRTAGRVFALTFGFGKALLQAESWEQEFGLKFVLNSVDEDSIREIELSGFDALLQNKQAQSVRDANIDEFEFDVDQDVLRSIRGTPKSSTFGRHVSGRDCVHISCQSDVTELASLLAKIFEESLKTTYVDKFSWVGRMKEVRSSTQRDSLDAVLVEKLKNGNLDRTWIAPPEYTRWKDGSAFRYPFSKGRYEDIHLGTLLAILKSKDKIEGLNVDSLKRWHIEVIDENDTLQAEWSIYRCLYAEVEADGSTFLLNNALWYGIEKDFLKEVSEEVETIPPLTIDLPSYNDADEEAYNLRVSQEKAHFCCMDRKTVELKKRGLTKIEFCDLYGLDKEMVHVKRYTGSSELSHLFQQGVVSAELFSHEPEFRKLVNDRLCDTHKMADPEGKLDATQYQVVYGIISKSKKDLSLPFFSKIVLRNAKRRLSELGYEIRIGKIARADGDIGDEQQG
jgi:uncharacterized protein (TIGR04141 family)